jgi:hypothetical protein
MNATIQPAIKITTRCKLRARSQSPRCAQLQLVVKRQVHKLELVATERLPLDGLKSKRLPLTGHARVLLLSVLVLHHVYSYSAAVHIGDAGEASIVHVRR